MTPLDCGKAKYSLDTLMHVYAWNVALSHPLTFLYPFRNVTARTVLHFKRIKETEGYQQLHIVYGVDAETPRSAAIVKIAEDIETNCYKKHKGIPLCHGTKKQLNLSIRLKPS